MFLSNGAIVPLASPASFGDSTPMFHNANYYATGGIPLEQAYAAYGAIYRQQLWVGVVVRKLATGTARMPFEVRTVGPSGLMTLEAGPLQQLMDKPNRRMSGFQLWQWTKATRDVYGEAFWLKFRDDKGRVRELVPAHPSNIIVRSNGEGGLEYVYAAGSAGRAGVEGLPVFAEEDVVAFTSYNPDNLHRGVSNLEALRMTLLNEDAARRATASFWHKGARPSMILTHPNELSEGAQERLKKKAESIMGGADNMGGVTVFEEGIQATMNQLSNEDMQYIESRKLNREEVCAAYDVSPVVVHILDHATFSNVTEQLRSQYRDTMAPIFSELQAVVDTQLVPDFYPATGDARTRFNMDDVLRGDWEARATTAQALRQSGLYTGNEARGFVGADPLDDPLMDKVFANSALQPLGEKQQPGTPQPGQAPTGGGAAAAEAAAAGAPPAGLALEAGIAATKEQAAKGFLDRAGRAGFRSIMGALPGKLKAAGTKADARAVLVEAHTAALREYYAALGRDVTDTMTKAAGDLFRRDVWDANLKQVLATLAKSAADVAGNEIADSLGVEFSAAAVEDWLDINSELGAELFNESTAQILANMLRADFADEAAKLAAVQGQFTEGGMIYARAAEQAATRVTIVSEFTANDTAKKADGTVMKTWEVNSRNPRPEHASVNGETVGVEDLFSNGMEFPGDWNGGVDNVAGCQCTVSYAKTSD